MSVTPSSSIVTTRWFKTDVVTQNVKFRFVRVRSTERPWLNSHEFSTLGFDPSPRIPIVRKRTVALHPGPGHGATVASKSDVPRGRLVARDERMFLVEHAVPVVIVPAAFDGRHRSTSQERTVQEAKPTFHVPISQQ
jgi:hypothetical protein